MNLGLQMQEEGFIAQLSVDATPLTLVRTGKQFAGVIEPAAPLEPANMLFGSDLREDAILHVLRRDCPAIIQGDRVTDSDSFTRSDVTPANQNQPPDAANPTAPQPIIYKVTKRIDDPADAVVRFTLVKVTEQDTG